VVNLDLVIIVILNQGIGLGGEATGVLNPFGFASRTFIVYSSAEFPILKKDAIRIEVGPLFYEEQSEAFPSGPSTYGQLTAMVFKSSYMFKRVSTAPKTDITDTTLCSCVLEHGYGIVPFVGFSIAHILNSTGTFEDTDERLKKGSNFFAPHAGLLFTNYILPQVELYLLGRVELPGGANFLSAIMIPSLGLNVWLWRSLRNQQEKSP